MKLSELQLEEGYTLKKTKVDKWEGNHFVKREPNETDGGATKGKTVSYKIIDNKTNKEVGTAEVESDNWGGQGSIIGKFLGKNFRIDSGGGAGGDPQSMFNKFLKWPSTKKKFAKVLGEDSIATGNELYSEKVPKITEKIGKELESQGFKPDKMACNNYGRQKNAFMKSGDVRKDVYDILKSNGFVRCKDQYKGHINFEKDGVKQIAQVYLRKGYTTISLPDSD